MDKRVFRKMDKEKAIDFRSRLQGLEDHPGFQLLLISLNAEVRDLKGEITPLVDDSFSALNEHNRRLHRAEAFEYVLEWVQNAKAQCNRIAEGDRK